MFASYKHFLNGFNFLFFTCLSGHFSGIMEEWRSVGYSLFSGLFYHLEDR